MSILSPKPIPPAAMALKEYLQANLKGQPEAIEEIVKAYIAFLSKIREFDDQEKKKPICVLLFLGHPGTGKTESGRILAKKFHGTSDAATIIECGSYQDKHEITSRLIGAPPGYIGYEDKPVLSKEKLYAKIPGYQTKPSAKIKNDKKETERKNYTHDLDAGEVFDFWLSQLDLIDYSLDNLNKELAELPKLNLTQHKLESAKKTIVIQKENLENHRNYILASYTKLVYNFQQNITLFQKPPTSSIEANALKVKRFPAQPVNTEKIPLEAAKKEEPILVIIFDEIEKAPEALRQFLLHLMEEGRAILANGNEVDLSRAFIILTSNIASGLINKAAKGVSQIGFASSTGKNDLEKMVKVELRKRFSPEFLRRLTATVVFNLLSLKDFREILELKIKNLASYLSEKYIIELEVELDVQELILQEAGQKSEEQVKALWDSFKKHLSNPIGNLLATGQLTSHKKLIVALDAQKKQVLFKN